MGLRVLVLSAHVDDAEFGCGGTIYRHLEHGDNVQWHTMVGNGYEVPQAWPKDTLAQEFVQSMKTIGIDGVGDWRLHLFKLNQLDTTRPEEGDSKGPRDVVFEIWRDFNPDVAYVPWRGSRHQDHRALADYSYQVSWGRNTDIRAYAVANDMIGFIPTVFSPLVQDEHDVKMDALDCYLSQKVLRSWFTRELADAFMRSYVPFVNLKPRPQYVEAFEQVKRVV